MKKKNKYVGCSRLTESSKWYNVITPYTMNKYGNLEFGRLLKKYLLSLVFTSSRLQIT